MAAFSTTAGRGRDRATPPPPTPGVRRDFRQQQFDVPTPDPVLLALTSTNSEYLNQSFQTVILGIPSTTPWARLGGDVSRPHLHARLDEAVAR